MHSGEIHIVDLGQAGKNVAVYLGVRLLESGDDDLSERLEIVSEKFSDFQIFKISGKNSGDSSCDSLLRQNAKKKAFCSEIREGMLEKGKFRPAVLRIEVIRRIQVQD